MVDQILAEFATGYALFEVVQAEAVGAKLREVQEASQDLSRFGRFVKLSSFFPYRDAASALQNVKDISEGILNNMGSQRLK